MKKIILSLLLCICLAGCGSNDNVTADKGTDKTENTPVQKQHTENKQDIKTATSKKAAVKKKVSISEPDLKASLISRIDGLGLNVDGYSFSEYTPLYIDSNWQIWTVCSSLDGIPPLICYFAVSNDYTQIYRLDNSDEFINNINQITNKDYFNKNVHDTNSAEKYFFKLASIARLFEPVSNCDNIGTFIEIVAKNAAEIDEITKTIKPPVWSSTDKHYKGTFFSFIGLDLVKINVAIDKKTGKITIDTELFVKDLLPGIY